MTYIITIITCFFLNIGGDSCNETSYVPNGCDTVQYQLEDTCAVNAILGQLQNAQPQCQNGVLHIVTHYDIDTIN